MLKSAAAKRQPGIACVPAVTNRFSNAWRCIFCVENRRKALYGQRPGGAIRWEDPQHWAASVRHRRSHRAGEFRIPPAFISLLRQVLAPKRRSFDAGWTLVSPPSTFWRS